MAGRVEAVGKNVTQLQPGDEVFGWCDGSFAEYASVPEGQLARKPANLTFEQAAAVPISGFAALQALRDTGQVQTGQKVVVETGQRADGQFKVLRLTSDTSFAAEFAAECDLIGSQPTRLTHCPGVANGLTVAARHVCFRMQPGGAPVRKWSLRTGVRGERVFEP